MNVLWHCIQYVVLTFGVRSKLKSNAASTQLKLTQKILSNNCGCISQCMRTNYCEILQLLLSHVYSIIGIYKRALPSNVGQFVSRLATFNTHLCWNFFNLRVSKCSWALDTIQDIVCKLGIKPLMHLVEIKKFCSIWCRHRQTY